jgi:serine/threonine protein phosphatase 1
MILAEPRQFVVGDVHGHYDGLLHLFALMAPRTVDAVVFLGDLIDRGPKSAQVVDFVKMSGYPCLLGNHEQLMLDACRQNDSDYTAFQLWLSCGGRQTVDSYESSELLQDHVDWMATLPNYLDLGAYWLVHAGVHPDRSIESQTTQELCWIRGEFHRMTTPYFSDKTIVTGHTITFTFPGLKPGQIAKGAGWLDIDTGAYHPKSGWLTAIEVNEEKVYQVNVFNQEERICHFDELIIGINPKKFKARL